MKANVRYPLMIGGLLSIPVTVVTIAIVVMSGDKGFAVEPNYYQKAVSWDAEMAQRRANLDLGWSVRWTATAAGSPAGPDLRAVRPGTVLDAALVDRQGDPVAGAAVTVVLFHNGESGRRVEQALKPDATGSYRGGVAMERDGLWELRLTATRGPVVFTDRQRLDMRQGASR